MCESTCLTNVARVPDTFSSDVGSESSHVRASQNVNPEGSRELHQPMLSLRHILVATDFSPISLLAVVTQACCPVVSMQTLLLSPTPAM